VIHRYLSTACIHEKHDYCVAPVVSRDGSWRVIRLSLGSQNYRPLVNFVMRSASVVVTKTLREEADNASRTGNVSTSA
jgi:hypothetical protein